MFFVVIAYPSHLVTEVRLPGRNIRNGHLDALRVLADAGERVGCAVDGDALLQAVLHVEAGEEGADARAAAVAAELLRRGARDARGVALAFACQRRALAVVQALLDGGVDVNATPDGADGITALMTAAEHGPPALVRALLAGGAAVATADSGSGWTALH